MASSQFGALKDEVSKVLNCALQPDSEMQRLAEERKKALEMTDEYPDILIDLISSSEEASPVAQMAATFLKNYLEETYYRNQTISLNPAERRKLVFSILELLKHKKDVIRQMMSYSLVTLVVREFPAMWDCVSIKIKQYLVGQQLNEVNGAVQFMKDLFCDSSSCDIIYFYTDFLPPLLAVFRNETYPTNTRCDSLQCIIFVAETMSNQPGFEEIFKAISPSFNLLLSHPYSGENTFRLKGDIIMKITYLLYRLGGPKCSYLVTSCLPPIGELMFNCCIEYKKFALEQHPIPKDPDEDEDPRNFRTLILNILNLLDVLLESDTFTSVICRGLDDLLYFLITVMCIPPESDTLVFTEDDFFFELDCDIIIRQTSINTFMNMMAVCEWTLFSISLGNIFEKLTTEAGLARQTSEEYYARITEVLMCLLGLLSNNFLNHEIAPDCGFCPGLYLDMWNSLLDCPNPHRLMMGRLLWLGSRFTSTIHPNILQQHLNAISRSLSSSYKPLRIAAVQALKNHLKTIQNNPNRLIILNGLTNVRQPLLYQLSHLEMIGVIPIAYFQTLTYMFEIDPRSAILCTDRCLEIIVESIQRFLWNDPVLKEINSLISKLCVIIECQETIVKPLVNFTLKLVYRNDPTKKIDATERGLAVLNGLIKYIPEPIEDAIILQTFSAAYSAIIESDDGTSEVATSCIANILMKCYLRIQTLTDMKGKPLSQYIPEIIYRLLESNSAGTTGKLGRLCIISMIVLLEQIQPHMESIVKAVLSSLQRCRDEVATQNLCFVFACIFMCETANITNFLSGIPGPDGKSALEYFLNKWKPSHILLSPKFERKLCTLAICKMIEYGVTGNDLRINEADVLMEIDFEKFKFSGFEYLYHLLLQVLDSELIVKSRVNDALKETKGVIDDEDVLIRKHPLFDLDLSAHIITFIRNYDTIYYRNVVKHIKEREFIDQLNKLGILPRH